MILAIFCSQQFANRLSDEFDLADTPLARMSGVPVYIDPDLPDDECQIAKTNEAVTGRLKEISERKLRRAAAALG